MIENVMSMPSSYSFCPFSSTFCTNLAWFFMLIKQKAVCALKMTFALSGSFWYIYDWCLIITILKSKIESFRDFNFCILTILTLLVQRVAPFLKLNESSKVMICNFLPFLLICYDTSSFCLKLFIQFIHYFFDIDQSLNKIKLWSKSCSFIEILIAKSFVLNTNSLTPINSDSAIK